MTSCYLFPVQIVDSYPVEGAVHRMVDVSGDFKVIRISKGKRIKAIVEQICPTQVICTYINIHEVDQLLS